MVQFYSLQRHGATVSPDDLLQLFGRRPHKILKPVGRDRQADPRGVDELQALHVLPLKVRMVRTEVGEALLYGCAT